MLLTPIILLSQLGMVVLPNFESNPCSISNSAKVGQGVWKHSVSNVINVPAYEGTDIFTLQPKFLSLFALFLFYQSVSGPFC